VTTLSRQAGTRRVKVKRIKDKSVKIQRVTSPGEERNPDILIQMDSDTLFVFICVQCCFFLTQMHTDLYTDKHGFSYLCSSPFFLFLSVFATRINADIFTQMNMDVLFVFIIFSSVFICVAVWLVQLHCTLRVKRRGIKKSSDPRQAGTRRVKVKRIKDKSVKIQRVTSPGEKEITPTENRCCRTYSSG
jgi:hypothetical protein